MTALVAALNLAERGLPVFPCGANKRPAISKNDGGNGFHDATTDSDEIRRLFDRPEARLVGVPTGEASGGDVLDIDPRHGGDVWEAEIRVSYRRRASTRRRAAAGTGCSATHPECVTAAA